MTLRLYLCPHCRLRYPLTLATGKPVIKGHYIAGRECPGSFKPPSAAQKGEQ